jgi:hypothetical protein
MSLRMTTSVLLQTSLYIYKHTYLSIFDIYDAFSKNTREAVRHAEIHPHCTRVHDKCPSSMHLKRTIFVVVTRLTCGSQIWELGTCQTPGSF